MRKALRYRLFGMGKMPEALATAAASADVLLADEGIPARNRVSSLRVPGARVSGGFRTASGVIVILPRRLLASIGRYVIVDSDFGGQNGQADLDLTVDGVRISFDVASVVTGGSGTVEVRYRLALDPALLAQLPQTRFPVHVRHAAEALINPWQGSYAGGASRAGR